MIRIFLLVQLSHCKVTEQLNIVLQSHWTTEHRIAKQIQHLPVDKQFDKSYVWNTIFLIQSIQNGSLFLLSIFYQFVLL